jgi:hypothetical protein
MLKHYKASRSLRTDETSGDKGAMSMFREQKNQTFFGTNFKAVSFRPYATHTAGFTDFYDGNKTSLNAFLMRKNVNQTKGGCCYFFRFAKFSFLILRVDELQVG